ncbi:DUF3530 family protein [Dongshaea marina]|uniref:DUF3530 family protein n=1 Tax=Dongshaea marina TaxID=2047966 RepID=UPI00131F0CE9|nr:DUF3530 family protein [Dongshaea marina]
MLLLGVITQGKGLAESHRPQPIPPIAEQHWQQLDWQGHPMRLEGKSVTDSSVILLLKSRKDHKPEGLALIMADSPQTLKLQALSGQLSLYGLDVLLLIPSPQQAGLNPFEKPESPELQLALKQKIEFIRNLKSLLPKAGKKRVVITQGKMTGWISEILGSKQLTEPDALVLLNGYYPQAKANTSMADSLAKLKKPLLDLQTITSNPWLTRARDARKQAFLTTPKNNFRQISAFGHADVAKIIYGWLSSEGWFPNRVKKPG